MRKQRSVTAYLSSKQLLLFICAQQSFAWFGDQPDMWYIDLIKTMCKKTPEISDVPGTDVVAANLEQPSMIVSERQKKLINVFR